MSSEESLPGASPRITYQLVLASAVSAGFALLTAVCLMIGFEYWNQRHALLEDSRVEAAIVADNASAALLFQDARTAQEILSGLRASPVIAAAGLFGNDGRVLADYRRLSDAAPPAIPPELKRDGYVFTLRQLEIVHPVEHQGHEVGQLYLRKSLEQIHSRLLLYALSSIAVAIGALLLAVAIIARVRRVVMRVEDRLHVMAHVDAVTGLANRYSFNERLRFFIAEASEFGETIAVFMIDLDNFKTVNDTLGHLAGDELLAQVARRLQELLRRDDVVGRLGGDEFAVALHSVQDEHEALLVAAKIAGAFAAPYLIEGQEFHVTGSVGISLYPRDADEQEALLRNADTAMYQAKSDGKNTWRMFAPAMDVEVKTRLALENSLRRALAHDELTLHYQPLVDLASGRVVGAEALLRWNSAEHGSVSPVDFIPIAEDSGLILSIGEWVIRTACHAAAGWNAAGGAPVYVAVNLSAKQLRDDSLLDRVLAILGETGLPAGILELELTESVIMENVHAQIEILRRLKSHGVRLAVDDFGTGYSSMAYLRRLPLDKLKIDRAFVRDLPAHENDCAIASAIIALAHSLGLVVVAEGVETEAQVDFLRTQRCDLLQGYLLGRPMPLADFEALLARERRMARPPARD